MSESASDQPVAEQTDAPPRRGPWGAVRGALARYLRFTARHRLIGCLGLLVLVGGLCIGASFVSSRLSGTREYEPLTEVAMLDVNETGAVINPPEQYVDRYIAAMTAFDAQGMWETYNERIRTELSSRGQNPAQLQQLLTEAKSRGATVDKAQQIGSYPLRDGRRFVFYIVSRNGFPPSGGPEDIYFIFTVDPEGRILSVT